MRAGCIWCVRLHMQYKVLSRWTSLKHKQENKRGSVLMDRMIILGAQVLSEGIICLGDEVCIVKALATS
jgi:hypothetical protein